MNCHTIPVAATLRLRSASQKGFCESCSCVCSNAWGTREAHTSRAFHTRTIIPHSGSFCFFTDISQNGERLIAPRGVSGQWEGTWRSENTAWTRSAFTHCVRAPTLKTDRSPALSRRANRELALRSLSVLRTTSLFVTSRIISAGEMLPTREIPM